MENWKKTFSKIFAGQLCSILTSTIVQYAIIWYLTYETGSAIVLSVATIISILPQILLGPFAGVIVDRIDRKKIMIFADSFIAFTRLLLIIVFAFHIENLAIIFAVMFLDGIASAFHQPAFQSSIPLMVPEDKIVTISGLNQTVASVATMLSPVLAGILYSVTSMQNIIALDIIGAIIGVSVILTVKIPKIETRTERIHIFREMKEGFQELKADKFLFSLTIIVTLGMILYMPSGALFPLVTKDYFGLSAIYASIIEFIFSLGMIIAGLLLAKFGTTKKKQFTIILATIVFGIAMLITGLLPKNLFIGFVVTTLFMGLAVPYLSGVYTALVQIRIQPEKLGRVFSILNSLMLMGTPIGLLLAAPIAEKIGVMPIFLFCGIALIIVSLIAMLLPTIRNFEEEHPEIKVKEDTPLS